MQTPSTNKPRSQLQIRLSDAERNALADAAERDGMPLSTWLRWVALAAARASAKKMR